MVMMKLRQDAYYWLNAHPPKFGFGHPVASGQLYWYPFLASSEDGKDHKAAV